MKDAQVFDLLAAKLDAHKHAMIAELNRELFAVGSLPPVVPLTWREHVRMRRLQTRRYLVTLWDALRGRDPYDSEDWD